MPWLDTEVDRWEALGHVFGSTPLPEAIARCDALYPENSTSRWVAIRRGLYIGTLLAYQGHVADGMRLQDQARDLAVELGVDVAVYEWWKGMMLFEGGQPEDAIPHLIAGVENTLRTGDRNHASTDAAAAAHALAQAGRYAEAEQYVEMARDWSAADDLSTQMLWRGALARTRASSGAIDEAEQLAREAVALCDGTDFAAASGVALTDLAWVSARLGKPDQAVMPPSRRSRSSAAAERSTSAAKPRRSSPNWTRRRCSHIAGGGSVRPIRRSVRTGARTVHNAGTFMLAMPSLMKTKRPLSGPAHVAGSRGWVVAGVTGRGRPTAEPPTRGRRAMTVQMMMIRAAPYLEARFHSGAMVGLVVAMRGMIHSLSGLSIARAIRRSEHREPA